MNILKRILHASRLNRIETWRNHCSLYYILQKKEREKNKKEKKRKGEDQWSKPTIHLNGRGRFNKLPPRKITPNDRCGSSIDKDNRTSLTAEQESHKRKVSSRSNLGKKFLPCKEKCTPKLLQKDRDI